MNTTGHVMVVDDDNHIRKVISTYLTKIGYEVVPAADGKEALDKFEQGYFDVILSDLVMPEMDGLELLKQIRELDSDVAFLIITGHPSVETAVNAIKNGAYDYIEKPVQLDEMRRKIERAFESKTLKDQLKSSKAFAWALLISIPGWLLLGFLLMALIRR